MILNQELNILLGHPINSLTRLPKFNYIDIIIVNIHTVANMVISARHCTHLNVQLFINISLYICTILHLYVQVSNTRCIVLLYIRGSSCIFR